MVNCTAKHDYSITVNSLITIANSMKFIMQCCTCDPPKQYVTVHAERDHKSAKRNSNIFADFALTDLFLRCTKFVADRSLRCRDTAIYFNFVHRCRETYFAKTAIFVSAIRVDKYFRIRAF